MRATHNLLRATLIHHFLTSTNLGVSQSEYDDLIEQIVNRIRQMDGPALVEAYENLPSNQPTSQS